MAEVLVARLQVGRRPFGMVGRVGVFLALEAYAHVLGILHTVLAQDVGIAAHALEVGGVDLYAGLVGEDLQEDARLGAIERGCHLCVVTLVRCEVVGVQTEVMVDARGVFDLLEGGVVDNLGQASR